MIGRRYGDRYEVSRELGSGGMAEVYLARDDQLGRNIALKVMHPEYARDRSFIERFRREAQAAARLNDPRVVSIYDWGSDDGTYYIVMEYVDGRTLREILQQDGRIEPDRAAEIAADICGALHLAHEQGIVHRDVKTGNIIVTQGRQTKVTDFGIARAATETGQTVTQTGTVIGTAAYLSPEQAQGMSVDGRSDIYSAAVVLYEMLTGEVPFKGDTPVAIAYKHVTEYPRPPSSINPGLPEELDAIVMKGLAKNPDNRYQTAEEMAGDLRSFLRGEPVEATPVLADQDTIVTSRTDRTAVVGGVPVNDATTVMPPMAGARGRRGLVYTLTFLLFLGIIVAVIALIYSLLSSGERVAVPRVIEKPYEEAKRILEEEGFEVVQGPDRSHDTIPPGLVMLQSPADGQKAPKGSPVTLTVSLGPLQTEIPNVAGKSEQDAEQALLAANLKKGGVRREPSDTVPEGQVVGTDPAAGQTVKRDSSVTLIISSGKRRVKVPNVVGISEEAARERLLNVGLEVKTTKVCQTSENDNRVLDQNPNANEEVGEGTEVTITVNDTQVVPNVIDQTEASARSELEQAGFLVEVTRGPGPDRVTRQDPDQGLAACAGNVVRIRVGTV